VLRRLAYTMAAAFFVATIFQLADQLNLIYQPPAVPDSASLVERVTAQIPYRQQVWPIYSWPTPCLVSASSCSSAWPWPRRHERLEPTTGGTSCSGRWPWPASSAASPS
jgi:hypothetical protein